MHSRSPCGPLSGPGLRGLVTLREEGRDLEPQRVPIHRPVLVGERVAVRQISALTREFSRAARGRDVDEREDLLAAERPPLEPRRELCRRKGSGTASYFAFHEDRFSKEGTKRRDPFDRSGGRLSPCYVARMVSALSGLFAKAFGGFSRWSAEEDPFESAYGDWCEQRDAQTSDRRQARLERASDSGPASAR